MKLSVIGGNGYVGSSICRAALKRGWKVSSVSRSGAPFVTSGGHVPGWTKEVTWIAGDASSPGISDTLAGSDAVVSTAGILFQDSYKTPQGSPSLGLLGERFKESVMGGNGNPLQHRTRTYASVNRDIAVNAFRAFKTTGDATTDKAFVFISAEDISRPVVPREYIETKRQAETVILTESGDAVRPIIMRPGYIAVPTARLSVHALVAIIMDSDIGLIYHPHLRPITTLPATALSIISKLQKFSPVNTQGVVSFAKEKGVPLPSFADSVANLLAIPPIHCDTLGEAVCLALENKDISGIVDTKRIAQITQRETL